MVDVNHLAVPRHHAGAPVTAIEVAVGEELTLGVVLDVDAVPVERPPHLGGVGFVVGGEQAGREAVVVVPHKGIGMAVAGVEHLDGEGVVAGAVEAASRIGIPLMAMPTTPDSQVADALVDGL